MENMHKHLIEGTNDGTHGFDDISYWCCVCNHSVRHKKDVFGKDGKGCMGNVAFYEYIGSIIDFVRESQSAIVATEAMVASNHALQALRACRLRLKEDKL